MRIALVSLVIVGLAACGSPSEEDVLTQQKIEASRSAPELPDVNLSDNPEPKPAEPPPADDMANGLLNEMAPDDGNGIEPDEGAEDLVPVPAAFRGRWGMSVEDCIEPRRPGSMALEIGANSIALPDGEGRLFKTLGDFPERYVGIFNYDGDRGRWAATEELALTGSSKVLVRRVDGGTLRYRRCTRTGG
jgi:hypothetical protein